MFGRKDTAMGAVQSGNARYDHFSIQVMRRPISYNSGRTPIAAVAGLCCLGSIVFFIAVVIVLCE